MHEVGIYGRGLPSNKWRFGSVGERVVLGVGLVFKS
jgi:hypothetical protein